MSVQVVDGDLVTAYGVGFDACWNGLLAGRSAVKPFSRFSTDPFQCHGAAVLDGLTYRQGESVVWQMITRLLGENDPRIPDDAMVLLASTTGEVDLLEQSVDSNESNGTKSKLAVLLEKVCARLSNPIVGQASCIQEPLFVANQDTRSRIRQPRPTIKKRHSAVISSACSSATVALAQGAEMIKQGEHDCVVVVACDAVTEFVYSGFASLMALDPDGARPFDADRRGLSVGEAAGFILLMSSERAEKENRAPLGELAGWGMSNDANHMTGPSRDGSSLAKAMDASLRRAAVSATNISMICAHGTGTGYNDSMELKAFKTVFSESKPTFSVKGGTGHTMGAAGLLEVLITLRAQQEGVVLQTVSLKQPAEDATGWVSSEVVSLKNSEWALSTNSGFGGVNAALVLRKAGKRGQRPHPQRTLSVAAPVGRGSSMFPNVIGAGWVSKNAYGTVQKQIQKNYNEDLYPSLKEDGILGERVKNFGRFDTQTRRAFCAAALALHDADFSKDWKNVGVIGTGTDECTQANQTYFEDYAGHGRKLARANLFIYTLPTSSLAEIAIHFKLDGPLFYTSEHIFPAAQRLLSTGETSHVLALWSKKDFTAALLLNTEDGNVLENFQTLEAPEQLINFLTADGHR